MRTSSSLALISSSPRVVTSLPDREITIERLGMTLAVGYGRTVLDASLAALTKVRQMDFVETQSPPTRSEVS